MIAASRAISHHKVRSARLRINRVETLEIDCRDRDGVDTIGVTIKVALVTRPSTVSTGKDKYRSLATTPTLDTVQNRTFDEIARGLHGLAVIRGTPGAAVNGCILIVVIECGSLVDV